jgi:GNAT superfamily N-acetyltransferase
MTFIRPMLIKDIEHGMTLSTAEGWNQTENDWKLFIQNPENICLVAESGNKVIGTTAAINYGNEVAWIGMVLVDKNYRGMGVANSLLTNILEKLHSFKSIKLDATLAGQQVYKKLGFEDEYGITRMTNFSIQNLPEYDTTEIFPQQIQFKKINEAALFDQHVFGANRTQLIKYLITEYPNKSRLLKRNNAITGFSLGRDGNKYHHIGPVMASTISDAKILISGALKGIKHQSAVVDVLNDKDELIDWLTSIGFVKQRTFVRMYKKENTSQGELHKLYLISGPEFG